eukprot:6180130-Pleurochrysis_carterae.AAC.1
MRTNGVLFRSTKCFRNRGSSDPSSSEPASSSNKELHLAIHRQGEFCVNLRPRLYKSPSINTKDYLLVNTLPPPETTIPDYVLVALRLPRCRPSDLPVPLLFPAAPAPSPVLLHITCSSASTRFSPTPSAHSPAHAVAAAFARVHAHACAQSHTNFLWPPYRLLFRHVVIPKPIPSLLRLPLPPESEHQPVPAVRACLPARAHGRFHHAQHPLHSPFCYATAAALDLAVHLH